MKKRTPTSQATVRRTAVSRGRLYLQTKLPWLAGFPVSQENNTVTWQVLPRYGTAAPHRVVLQRQELHEATYASTRLIHHYAPVLTNIVDEPSAWQANLPLLLDLLKTGIHQNQPLPESLHNNRSLYPVKIANQADALLEHEPRLRPLLSALSWVCILSPRDMRVALAWIEKEHEMVLHMLTHSVAEEGVLNCLILWHLVRQDGKKRLQPLTQWLRDDRFYTMGSYPAHEWIKALHTRLDETAEQPDAVRPAPVLWANMIPFLHWLYLADPNTRQRALHLFDLLLDINFLDEWALWWAEVEPYIDEADQLEHERLYHHVNKERTAVREKFRETLIKRHREHPPYLRLKEVDALIRALSAKTNVELHTAVCALLAQVPSRYGQLNWHTRPPLLKTLLEYNKRYERPHLIRLINDWAQHRRRYKENTLDLYLWQDIFARWHMDEQWYYWGFLTRFLRGSYPRTLFPQAMEAVQRCLPIISKRSRETFDEETIVDLLQATGSIEQTEQYYRALAKVKLHDEYFNSSHFRTAHALAETDVDFVQISKILLTVSEQNFHKFETLSALLQDMAKHSWLQLAHDGLQKGHLPLLLEIGSLRSALVKMHEKTPLPSHPIPTAVPEWCARYPAELHPLLGPLASLSPDAEQVAERLLGKQFPNPSLLKREMQAIQKRLGSSLGGKLKGLQQRLGSLQSRLVAPREVSPQKLANLEEKLLQALHRAILQNWRDDLVMRLHTKLQAIFGIGEMPDWFLEPKQLEIIAPMLTLKAGFRNLGVRLFQERCGPRPWGLRNAPANQAFVDKMHQRKIDMEVWLTPAPPKIYTAPNGKQVSIALCDDPLEIFHMGGHFRTCLSPGGFNFFSVFANAADVNKQVIYGRNEKGQIVGRCLLALTDEGGILTFEPYSHDPNLEFRNMVKEWVTDLAQQMKSYVLPHGRVSNLVAKDWYDDGSTDIAEQFQFLAYRAEFRLALLAIPTDEFVAALEKRFDSLPLNAFTLPLVLSLHEFSERPELVVPLLPYITACKNLPVHVLIRTASLAFHAGETEFARQIMQELSIAPILEAYRLFQWLDHKTMLGLAAMAPATTLKVLRRTRPSKVRADVQETHPHRVEQYAVAYEALGRPNRAAVMRARLAQIRKQVNE